MGNLERAYNFAEACNEPAVWSELGRGQLSGDQVKEAIDSYIRAGDPSQFTKIEELAAEQGTIVSHIYHKHRIIVCIVYIEYKRLSSNKNPVGQLLYLFMEISYINYELTATLGIVTSHIQAIYLVC